MKKRFLSTLLAAALAASTLAGSALMVSAETTEESSEAATDSSETEEATAEETQAALNPEDAKWHVQLSGKNGSLCNAPTYIAYENGYFLEEGVDVELISTDAETRKIALNNGSIPIVNGDFQFFPAIEQGLGISVVSGLHNGCIKLEVLPDSPIQSLEDLKGLTIGVDEIGGTTHQVMSMALEQNGISAKAEDGEVTFLPFKESALELEALKQGQIDAAVMWDPLGSVAEKSGEVRVVYDIGKDEPFNEHFCCLLYASNKVLDEDPELIAALLRAYHKAQNWIAENPAETAKIVTEKKYVSIEDLDLATDLLAAYNYPTEEFYAEGKQPIKDDVTYFAEQLYELGYLTTEPDEFVAKAFNDVDAVNTSK